MDETDLVSLIFTMAEVEVTKIILVSTEAMTEVEEILNKGHMKETEEASLQSTVRPRGYNNPRGSYGRQDKM